MTKTAGFIYGPWLKSIYILHKGDVGMTPPRKVAFVAVVSSACIHRRMRGAFSYADAHPNSVIRDFRMPEDIADREGAVKIRQGGGAVGRPCLPRR